MNIIKAVAFFILSAALCYLFGAFVSNIWDVTQWSQDGRFFCALGTLCGTMVGVIIENHK